MCSSPTSCSRRTRLPPRLTGAARRAAAGVHTVRHVRPAARGRGGGAAVRHAARGRRFRLGLLAVPVHLPAESPGVPAWLLVAIVVIGGLIWLVLRFGRDVLAAAAGRGRARARGDLERLAVGRRAPTPTWWAPRPSSACAAPSCAAARVWAGRSPTPASWARPPTRRSAARSPGSPVSTWAARRPRQGAQGHATGEAPFVTPPGRFVAILAGIASLLLAARRSCAKPRSPPAST